MVEDLRLTVPPTRRQLVIDSTRRAPRLGSSDRAAPCSRGTAVRSSLRHLEPPGSGTGLALSAEKRSLVENVTSAIVKTLDVKRDWVTVLIEEFERENWATGGVLHHDKLGPGFGKQGSE